MALEQIADPGFEARWTAWQQRGRTHDRQVRARLRIVLPFLAGLALALAYALLRQ